MGQLKSQIAWLLKGSSRTTSALTSYAEDLRALQLKVARIDDEVQAIRLDLERSKHVEARTDSELAGLKLQLRDAVDDLGDRVGNVADRLNSGQ